MVAVVRGGPGQEVPPIANPPRGAEVQGAVVLSANRQELGFTFGYDDLSGPAAQGHFHRGTPTEAGPVVQTICGAPPPALSGACPTGNSGVVSGVWRIPQNLLADLLAGRIYVNFHTAANPGGEVRGNITISR